MDKACTSIDRQNIVQGELLHPSPYYTERNIPKEFTLTLGITAFENAWELGGERKAY